MRDTGGREKTTANESGGRELDLSALPASFTSMISQATADEIASLLHAHPRLASPILMVVQKVRGNSFAQQISTHPLHRPTPGAEPSKAPATPETQPAPTQPRSVDPEKAKIIDRQKTAGWDQLATAAPDERGTPTNIRLPPSIVEALEKAWQDTLKTPVAHEQGGNLVKDYGGGYEVRRKPNDDARMFDQDDNDVGITQKLVGQVHTHPYREEKNQVPEQFASFSDGDFDSLMRSDAHVSVLRSGPYTFMLVKTKQFNSMINALGNEEDKLSAVAKRMTATYDKASDATDGSFSQKIEAGVMAVCEQFHLVYYEGQGGELNRKTKRPAS